MIIIINLLALLKSFVYIWYLKYAYDWRPFKLRNTLLVGNVNITLNDVSSYEALRIHDFDVFYSVFFANNCKLPPPKIGEYFLFNAFLISQDNLPSVLCILCGINIVVIL